MQGRIAPRVAGISLVCLLVFSAPRPSRVAASEPDVESLIAAGDFAAAERLLRAHIPDPDAPIIDGPAVQLEILRRTRQDFPLTAAAVFAELKKSIPDVTSADVDRWRASGELQARAIDGEFRYFREAVGNLFRASDEARRRRPTPPAPRKEFDTAAHVQKLLRLMAARDPADQNPELYPVKHRVVYELAVNEKHPRVRPGAKVRAWLPFPQVYRQQRDVKLITAEPAGGVIAQDAPQRTIYFEQTVADAPQPPRFRAEFEFTTSAYCPRLDPALVKPYRSDDPLYQEFTAERPPHIVFTPLVNRIAAEAIGDATNPLEKARRIFRWVTLNIPWCAEMEYSVIPNISAKGLAARRGDCGVQGLTFITLCRAAGVPARWQSGWQTKQPNWNMHDWSEFYVEPWGWLPADPSYGVSLRDHADPAVRDFFCGCIDPYRFIVNLDYACPLIPPKTSFRSEPNDFQRGEIEIDGHNLYFDEWDYKFSVDSQPLSETTD